MRDRKEIEKSTGRSFWGAVEERVSVNENLMIELLLDIRDLLSKTTPEGK